MAKLFIGIDMGTASLRVGVFNELGTCLKMAATPVPVYHPKEDFYEQKTTDITAALNKTLQEVVQGVDLKSIAGVGVDATCSLALLSNEDGDILGVSEDGDCDIVMWQDHRAKKQTDHFNKLNTPLLQFCGGKMNVELQLPKLMWLEFENPNYSFNRMSHAFDLGDYITYYLTASNTRSLCPVTCKWGYQKTGWPMTEFKKAGFNFLEKNRIGREIATPGESIGICKVGGQDVPVSASLIDAYAGAAGAVTAEQEKYPFSKIPLTERLVAVCGTSTCFMTFSEEAKYVPGIWGAYWNVLGNGLWMNEAGQSAAGKLLDEITCGIAINTLDSHLATLASKAGKSENELTANLHIQPDFHGNRSPLADPDIRGSIVGMGLEEGEIGVAVKYLAAMQALVYGTKYIVETLQSHEFKFKLLHACGGLSQNKRYVQLLSDVLSLEVVVAGAESVLLGSAIMGAVASGHYESVTAATEAMKTKGDVITPYPSLSAYHEKKYRVYRQMTEDQLKYRQMME